ncbi:MAG: hypothetical protein GWN84_16200 [Gammaproteobacteria bacterium]|nr:hypothetical protein [Gammaproteobacteria bacterium]NIR84330.1 hypothetical protein [Gammaproteobacteria bacterium]NIR89846.1 hypothetical protein [Gammaproteobacteria bacterium]NIU05713.1 hypothetical protein [Gammaproteobacteria bacterium]NIV52473.1 hypothetical protein [Gammaproteobacteria bacterium]
MCHLILLLPVLGLSLFWVAPLPVAGPIYGIVFLLSVWLYWLIMRSMKHPVETGMEQLRREVGEVVDAGDRKATVRVQNELWQCKCKEKLERGDSVKVLDVDGLTLRVEKLAGPGRGQDEPRATPRNEMDAIA